MSFLSDWRLNVNYTKVSDRRYFSDFDSDYGSSTDGYATQQFKLGYYQSNYNFSVSGKKLKFLQIQLAHTAYYRKLISIIIKMMR